MFMQVIFMDAYNNRKETSITMPITKKQEKMDISPRSLARRFFIGVWIFCIGTSLPVMFADACRPGNDIDVDQVKVPETAQLGLSLDRDIEWAAKLDGPVHPGRGRRFIGGVNGIGDVVGTFNL